MIGGALRQLVVLVPCLWLLIRTMGIDRAWFAFWVSEWVARFGVTSVTPFLLLPVHPEGYTPAHHT